MGSEAMLAPRLPSLFEPAQRDVAMPVMETHDTVAAKSANGFASNEARRAPAGEVLLRSVPDSTPPPVQPTTVREELAARHAASVRPALARGETETHRQAVRPTKLSGNADAAHAVVESRVRHEHVHQHVTPAVRDAGDGALLPPRGAVFSAQPMGRDRQGGEAVRQQTRADRHADGMEHEPVVHVSIGRLEVRAGPVPATASRHQDAPRRNAFDDYLRERGKAPS
ncbi:hypothetical protein CA260_09810 [Dyella jiangningensis]|uniref:Uncharacterized protein n=2 Tax=Dyella jiangningensis TaxID=1379159 RepID=A0A328P733_9GAMM|nr:hypothetical protein CA260_09810 [Dyella jiangningensis]